MPDPQVAHSHSDASTVPPRAFSVLLPTVPDIVLILGFAAIGRASHSEAHPVLESLVVAWPFLVGAAVAGQSPSDPWAASRARSRRECRSG